MSKSSCGLATVWCERNTKFFHTTTIIRRRKKKICGLMDDDGQWQEDQAVLGNMVRNHFHHLYTEENSSRDKGDLLNGFPIIAKRRLQALSRPVCSAEVKKAMFNIKATKAPGPDGICSGFYQKCWKQVGNSVVQFVQNIFNTRIIPDTLNGTLISLIPKVESPERVAHFRPISLCNVSYKVITKLIVERIRPLLVDLIAPYQCSFIPGREACNNIIVAQEFIYGDIFQAVWQAEQDVIAAESALDADDSEVARTNLHHARAVLRHKLSIEEQFWQQKSRVKWLQDGDRNTKYFHSIVAERRAKAVIHRIKSSSGVWLTSEADISQEAVDFFQGLFSAESGFTPSSLLEVISRVVTHEENAFLEDIPSLDEVKQVVFSMDGESAAGLDGFTGQFFTCAWDIIVEDLYSAVVSFFCGSELPKSVTATLIVLIPKVQNPQDFTQYRPISLCNFVNKVITRVLSDRLAKVLPRLISPQQSGFVKGRLITDNYLLAQELILDIGKKNRGGNVALKLDMAKAYDRVSWVYLTQVLRKFGFGERWIDMVWRVVSNCWFSVIINGTPQGFFKSSRGLRQGDPISPALFIIGAEVFSRALNNLALRRGFSPFKVPSGCPIVTHLAYADDVLIFSSGTRKSLGMVMEVIAQYELLSG